MTNCQHREESRTKYLRVNLQPTHRLALNTEYPRYNWFWGCADNVSSLLAAWCLSSHVDMTQPHKMSLTNSYGRGGWRSLYPACSTWCAAVGSSITLNVPSQMTYPTAGSVKHRVVKRETQTNDDTTGCGHAVNRPATGHVRRDGKTRRRTTNKQGALDGGPRAICRTWHKGGSDSTEKDKVLVCPLTLTLPHAQNT